MQQSDTQLMDLCTEGAVDTGQSRQSSNPFHTSRAVGGLDTDPEIAFWLRILNSSINEDLQARFAFAQGDI